MAIEYSRIIRKIEQNAEEFPKKICLSLGDSEYTFESLLAKIKDLSSAIDSSYLEKPIIVFANRDINTILYFLAVIFSGNFYVSIDPDMPIEKLAAIFEETGAKYCFGNITNKHILSILEKNDVVFFDINSSGNNNHYLPITNDFPLYMVYTSGSTGKPKGVLKTHGAMASFMETFHSTFEIGNDEIIGNQTPFFFDASAKDIYMMIETGARMEIIPSELFVIPTRLINYLNEKSITYISWVPSALSLIAQMKAFSYVKPQKLRRVFFVGEVMPVKSLNYWIKNLPNVTFVNLYGQSEIAGVACYYVIHSTYDESKTLPIGKPLQNCQIIILADGKEASSGECGEILISSNALAECYYHDQERTKNSFIYNNGVRFFKTGDYAYLGDDNNIIFASRRDSQIKHMGRRIELGEIETAAYSLDGVEKCCCLYDQESKRIVLFCQVIEGISISAIHSHLRIHLSPYMMPSKIVLGAIPLNANGKIDRQVLKNNINKL